jgi:hypothetical protein
MFTPTHLTPETTKDFEFFHKFRAARRGDLACLGTSLDFHTSHFALTGSLKLAKNTRIVDRFVNRCDDW